MNMDNNINRYIDRYANLAIVIVISLLLGISIYFIAGFTSAALYGISLAVGVLIVLKYVPHDSFRGIGK